MKNINKYARVIMLMVIILAIANNDLLSQCPMCRMAAETNLENGGTQGKGLNTGILYMLALPYLLVATIGFLWYRNRKLSEEQ